MENTVIIIANILGYCDTIDWLNSSDLNTDDTLYNIWFKFGEIVSTSASFCPAVSLAAL